MANPNFVATYSTNEIWRDLDDTRCLTDDLDAIESDISDLESGKADSNHTHSEYSPTSHTHTGYAETNHSHNNYALTEHSHSGYAPSNHGHSYNDLSDKPTIPAAYSHPASHPASMITGLSAVATSGNYSDLNGKPTIPTIPDSLPANGGNADTVDGKHASDFALLSHIHNPTVVTTAGTNLNDYVTPGIWSFAQAFTPTNIPAGSNGWLVVIPWGDGLGTVKQFWLRHGVPGEGDHEVYTRLKTTNDPWCSWTKFYTAKNPPTAEEIGYYDLTIGSITKASGVSSMDIAVKYNDFKAVVYGTFAFSSALAAGATAVIGTNLPSAMRPESSSETAVTFYGTRPLVIRVTTTGNLEVRNASDTALAANSSVAFRISYPIF